MGRVNFRDIRERFRHIDAEFVASCMSFDDGEPFYAVRFYPWWEHPNVAEAIKAGRSWKVADVPESAVRKVTVFPIRPIEYKLRNRSEVIDWAFLESHQNLWPYEDHGQIFCNSIPPMEKLIAGIHAAMPDVPKSTIYSYLDPLHGFDVPSCLGNFPLALFDVVYNELQKLDVSFYVEKKPQPRPTPVILLLDGEDYIIADDFELEVPKFKHDRKWCSF